MPVTREQKESRVGALAKELQGAQALILSDYRGLPNAELASLRNQLRGMKSGFHIAKNTLIKLALKQAGLPVPDDLLQGPTAITYCYGDIAGPAKALTNFLKEKELPVKGAIMSGRVLKSADAMALASLPTREQLYARLLGTMNAPGTKVAGVVASGIRQVLYVLQARKEQLQKQGAA
ncbi:MAG: 50S ribosomal protein L10 [Chloroflexi bacterium]|nr:50S ribosomal protein L10 [Chloroflexota bacterium]